MRSERLFGGFGRRRRSENAGVNRDVAEVLAEQPDENRQNRSVGRAVSHPT